MKRFGRTDANQQLVVSQLRDHPGISVYPTAAMGNGFPDLVVGFRKRTYLFELKDPAKPPSRQRLSKLEQGFFDRWTGHVKKVTSTQEILDEIGYDYRIDAAGTPAASK